MRPRIGIPCRELKISGKKDPVWGVISSYVESVEKVGGLPILIPLSNDKEELKEFFNLSHGILLTGGEDVNPSKYSQAPSPKLKSTSDSRDEVEMEIAKWAVKEKKPILAICRGIQVLNVALGGTLYQDIATETDTKIEHDLHGVEDETAGHCVTVTKDTKLSKIVKSEGTLKVNSLHHQSLKEIGKGLKVVAKSEDGIVEGVESEDPNCFCVGVQWHPEILWQKGESHALRLFEALVEASKKQ